MLTLLIISWAVIKISEHEGTIKVRDFNRGGERGGFLGHTVHYAGLFTWHLPQKETRGNFVHLSVCHHFFLFQIFSSFSLIFRWCLDYKNVLKFVRLCVYNVEWLAALVTVSAVWNDNVLDRCVGRSCYEVCSSLQLVESIALLSPLMKCGVGNSQGHPGHRPDCPLLLFCVETIAH